MTEKIEYKGYTIKVKLDEDNESPREWDNLGTMTCFHSMDEVKTHLKKVKSEFKNGRV